MKTVVKACIMICIFIGLAVILGQFDFAQKVFRAGTLTVSVGIILSVLGTMVAFKTIRI